MTQEPVWTIGDELRKARKAAGLEQTQLAALIGVSGKTISNWETGKHGEPTITQWRAIAEATNANWLLTGHIAFIHLNRHRLTLVR